MIDLPAMLGGTPACPQMVPFVRPTLPAVDTLLPEIKAMLGNGQLTKGRHLEAFEQAVADHLGVKHAIAVSSCTTGLMLAYRGLKLQGEVIVPSFTFMASVSSLVWAGLRPVFVDVDRATATIDPLTIERAITPRTTAIVAVHTFGNPAEIDQLQTIAARHGLALVFDAAHGFGAKYQGKPVGSQGDANVFSLSPTKLLVAGEGGIVATNRDDLAQQVRLGREYGNDGNYDSLFAGMNGRMAEFNALLGLHGLPLLEQVAARRNSLADLYRAELADVPGIETMTVRAGNRCSYKDMSILLDSAEYGLSRDQLAEALRAEQVDTRKYFYPAVHRQTAYAHFCTSEAGLTETNRLAEGSLSLPMGTHVSDDVVRSVCQAIRRIHQHAASLRERFASEPVAVAPSMAQPIAPALTSSRS